MSDLGLFFDHDVVRLLALALRGADRYGDQAFVRGYRAAIGDLAVGFGVAGELAGELVGGARAMLPGETVPAEGWSSTAR